MDTSGRQGLKPAILMSYLPQIVYTLKRSATPLCKYKQITSGQAFTWQESTKKVISQDSLRSVQYHNSSRNIRFSLSLSLSLCVSLSLSLSLSPLPVTSHSEPVSHQLLSLFSRFVLMLHCFAMLQSQSVNIFSLCISEREVFSPTPFLPPDSHQHTFTAVSLFCINCPYTEKISFALKNRARSI